MFGSKRQNAGMQTEVAKRRGCNKKNHNTLGLCSADVTIFFADLVQKLQRTLVSFELCCRNRNPCPIQIGNLHAD